MVSKVSMEKALEKTIVIIGFGNQAKAWGLNLRDSGWSVFYALRDNSQSIKLAKNMGFSVVKFNELKNYNTFAMLTPDNTHHEILLNNSENFKKGSHFIFAHGYSLVYDQLQKDFCDYNFSLLAPKAIASELRFRFESKDGLGAVYETKSEDFIKNLAADLGINSFFKTSAKHETVADLFSEQTILCALLPYGALESFNLLIRKGIEPEVAYFECWFEVKLIVDTMIKMGPTKFFEMISPNALIGSEIGRSLFFDDTYRKKLNDCFENIASGKFAEDNKNINISELKNEVKEFWNNQQLSKVHNTLAKDLFKEHL